MVAGATLRYLADPAEFEGVAADWDQAVANAECPGYFSHAWLSAWWAEYRDLGEPAFFLLYRDGDPVAALPFAIRTVGLRVATIAGASHSYSVYDFPSPGADLLECAARAADHLATRLGCDAVILKNVHSDAAVDPSRVFAPFGLANARRTPAVRFRLPETVDAYFAALSKRTRAKYRADLRSLEKTGALTFDILRGAAAAPFLDRFDSLHEAQWAAQGKGGQFQDIPRSLAFNRRLMTSGDARFEPCFFTIARDGALISAQLCYLYRDICYWRLPARLVTEELDQLGLGRIGLVKMIEWLIGNGYRQIEAGPQHYDYKVRFGGEPITLRTLTLAKGGKATQAKLLALGLRALSFGYANLLARRLGIRSKRLHGLYLKIEGLI